MAKQARLRRITAGKDLPIDCGDILACVANTGHSLNDGGKFELFDYYDISQF